MTKTIKQIIKRLLTFLLPKVEWHKAIAIVRACHLDRSRISLLLVFYYLSSMLAAVLDGAGMILLVELIAGEFRMMTDSINNPLVAFLLDLLPIDKGLVPVYLTAICLFLLRALVLFGVNLLDGYMQAKTRQVIQKNGLHAILRGEWEFLRDFRVGGKVGAITEEALHVAQFFQAIMRTLQGLLLAVLLSLMAISVSLPSAIIFLLIGIPVALIMKRLFTGQSLISERLITNRQKYYADVTEHLTGLFQLKVEDRLDAHMHRFAMDQYRLTNLEIRLWRKRAWVVLTNAMIPAAVLFLFYLASLVTGNSLDKLLYLLAGVGTLGLRVLANVNLASANISIMTSASGSITPVYDVLNIPRQTTRLIPLERIVGIRTEQLAYRFDRRPVFDGISLEVGLARPLIIKGDSGSGKTTLANLLAGLYEPVAGSITYLGEKGSTYDAREYRPRVGYVTQDIHLFHDTIRNNLLTPGLTIDDTALWDSLASVGAADFIKQKGGLDVILSEGGRSLSGGERRRIGIARAIVRNPHILILDEVTSGLDEKTKGALEATIETLSSKLVVVAITHDPLYFANHTEFIVPGR
jgi:ATP-binding cassette, subfamily C, bacterial